MPRPTVILIAPNRRVMRLIRFIVESTFAARVVTVDDLDQFWRALALERPHLIIVEATPQHYHQSTELATRLKSDAASAKIPLVALGVASDKKEALRSVGFDEVIPFPWSVKEVVAGVSSFVRLSSDEGDF